MNVLITGGNGFLGKYVRRKLETDGYEVTSVDIETTTPGTECLDVRDFTQVSLLFAKVKPKIVVHLAALTGSSGKGGGAESVKAPFDYFKVNVMGTLNVFEACRQNDIGRVIHMSSFSPYGVTKETITEETPFNPTNPYGFSKACSELTARCYATGYGIKTLILRSPLICGEGQKERNALREFVSSAVQGTPITILGEGKHLREWLHPEDVADAIARGIHYLDAMNDSFEVFVLGNRPISMNDLAQLSPYALGGTPQTVSR
jgi:nucleoside-diphosphate-sugar epimerase